LNDWRGDVLKFWFGLAPERWWRAHSELDQDIRRRFLKLWSEKRELPATAFTDHPLSALAAIILFDQFPRNIFRGQADQFATDHIARAIALTAVERKFDDELEPRERVFLYMPFQHSEDRADQRRSLNLFTALGDDYHLGFARKHYDVIERFGRFPHRNAILGRAPRPEETAAGNVVPW
jgi:uncharacterized protein (DUF924 family)